MSFSSTALQQRERESKTLRLFLACSLIGSLIFHIGLLASGIGKYLLTRVPEIEDETVEITLLDTPIKEIEPEEEVKPKPKPEPKPEIKPPIIDTSKLQLDLENTNRKPEISGGSPATSKSEPIPTQRKVTPQAPPVVKQAIPKPDIKPFQQFKQIEPLSPTSPVAVREKAVIPKQKPEPKPEPIAKNNIPAPPQPKPETTTAREFSTPVTPPIQPTQQDEDLKDLLAQSRDSNSKKTAREFSTPVTPPIQPPKPTQQDSEDLKDLLAQSRDSNSKRTAREFSTPVTPPVQPTQQNEDLKDLLAQSRDSNSKKTAREFSNPVTPPIQPTQQDEDLKDLLAQSRDSNSKKTAREFSNPVTPPIQPTQQDSGDLKNTLSGIRESRDNSKISSNNTAATLPDTSNIGESSDNAPRRKRRTFANNNLATGNGLGNGTGDSVGDRDGRAACVRCDKIYPAWAERQRIEGNVTVSVDTDAKGNVTNVQLIDSSGNNRLDNYHQRLARKWKLKPSSNGRKGVTIITKYEL